MARGRDSVILGSAALVDAAARLKTHMTSRVPSRLTAADPVERRGNVGLFVTPFGVPLAATQVARVGATTRAWSAGSAAVGTRTDVIGNVGTDSVLRLADYRPAKLEWQIQEANPRREQSEATGLFYIGYTAESNTVPFGKNGAADTYDDAITEILVTAEGLLTNANISFSPERLGRAWN